MRGAGRHERRSDSGGHVLMRGCGVPAGIVDGHPAIRSVLSRRWAAAAPSGIISIMGTSRDGPRSKIHNKTGSA